MKEPRDVVRVYADSNLVLSFEYILHFTFAQCLKLLLLYFRKYSLEN